jgi:hypothetical protein
MYTRRVSAAAPGTVRASFALLLIVLSMMISELVSDSSFPGTPCGTGWKLPGAGSPARARLQYYGSTH